MFVSYFVESSFELPLLRDPTEGGRRDLEAEDARAPLARYADAVVVLLYNLSHQGPSLFDVPLLL